MPGELARRDLALHHHRRKRARGRERDRRGLTVVPCDGCRASGSARAARCRSAPGGADRPRLDRRVPERRGAAEVQRPGERVADGLRGRTQPGREIRRAREGAGLTSNRAAAEREQGRHPAEATHRQCPA